MGKQGITADQVNEGTELASFDPLSALMTIKLAAKALSGAEVAKRIQAELRRVNTNPTPPQKDAGNYSKGHVRIHGMDISIENPHGTYRRGVDHTGKAWENKMHGHYGYIRGTVGADKEHLDVFIGPEHKTELVFVIDQVNPRTGEFDEHKCILGCTSKKEAQELYMKNYQRGWQGFGGITALTKDQFREWIAKGVRKHPASETPLKFQKAAGMFNRAEHLVTALGREGGKQELGNSAIEAGMLGAFTGAVNKSYAATDLAGAAATGAGKMFPRLAPSMGAVGGVASKLATPLWAASTAMDAVNVASNPDESIKRTVDSSKPYSGDWGTLGGAAQNIGRGFQNAIQGVSTPVSHGVAAVSEAAGLVKDLAGNAMQSRDIAKMQQQGTPKDNGSVGVQALQGNPGRQMSKTSGFATPISVMEDPREKRRKETLKWLGLSAFLGALGIGGYKAAPWVRGQYQRLTTQPPSNVPAAGAILPSNPPSKGATMPAPAPATVDASRAIDLPMLTPQGKMDRVNLRRQDIGLDPMPVTNEQGSPIRAAAAATAQPVAQAALSPAGIGASMGIGTMGDAYGAARDAATQLGSRVAPSAAAGASLATLPANLLGAGVAWNAEKELEGLLPQGQQLPDNNAMALPAGMLGWNMGGALARTAASWLPGMAGTTPAASTAMRGVPALAALANLYDVANLGLTPPAGRTTGTFQDNFDGNVGNIMDSARVPGAGPVRTFAQNSLYGMLHPGQALAVMTRGLADQASGVNNQASEALAQQTDQGYRGLAQKSYEAYKAGRLPYPQYQNKLMGYGRAVQSGQPGTAEQWAKDVVQPQLGGLNGTAAVASRNL